VVDDALEGSLLHVDACCWIDLFASEVVESIMAAIPVRWTVPEYVVKHEVLTTLSRSGIEQRCDLASLMNKGLVSILPIETIAEKRALIRFAAHLDDGEAAVCALASVHGGRVATNDRKVSAVLGRLQLPISVVGTPELIYRWAVRTEPSRRDLKQVLENITLRARFSPRRDALHAAWWYQSIAG
jgi:predicted nucleic acid-binding protein